MRPGERSRTADAAAAFRANHTLRAQSPVFSDPYAVELISPRWRALVRNPLLNRLVMRRVMDRLSPIVAQVVGRSRYAEEQLAAAVERGVGQYVIVGAGLDTFALRRADLAGKLRVYEVDHPATQGAKRDRLEQRGKSLPRNLEFVAVNFEAEDIAQGLKRSSYERVAPAFFSWLGTTHYLQPETTLATLKSIAGIAAPGSEIVFDYSLPQEMLPAEISAAAQRLRAYTARQGEPMIGGLEPKKLHGAMRRLGYEIIEDVNGEELGRRYFMHRADGLRPTRVSRLMHARVLPRA